jgi:hypothetical protein
MLQSNICRNLIFQAPNDIAPLAGLIIFAADTIQSSCETQIPETSNLRFIESWNVQPGAPRLRPFARLERQFPGKHAGREK